MPWTPQPLDEEIQPRIGAPLGGLAGLLTVASDAGEASAALRHQQVAAEVIAPGGARVAGITMKRGETGIFSTWSWQPGPYEIRVSRRISPTEIARRHFYWHKGDWKRQAGALLDRADGTPQDSGAPFDMKTRLLAAILLDRLDRDPRRPSRQWWSSDNPATETLSEVFRVLMEDREIARGGKSAIRPGGFARLAWRDPVDGSAQFARLYPPPDYDPSRKWPMIVRLHGYQPGNPSYHRWPGVLKRQDPVAERYGVIVLEPHARGSSWYGDIGEADVLRAISLAKQVVCVDEDRIYLKGGSMGGGGAWRIASHHPGMFAAVSCSGTGVESDGGMDAEQFEGIAPRSGLGPAEWGFFEEAESLRTTPVFVNHGDVDFLAPTAKARSVVAALQHWGYDVRYWEHPGKGHEDLWEDAEEVSWFLGRRLDRNPKEVRIRTARLKTASAHWVRVLQREDPSAPIQVLAWVMDPHTIRLFTENVLEVRLTPGRELVDTSQPVWVVWNDRDGRQYSFSDEGVVLAGQGYEPGQTPKRPTLEGPIGDLTATPFAIVVGTISDDPAMARMCRHRADAFRSGWQAWHKARPRFFLDTEITSRQLASYSLLLFGGPGENRVTRDLLPDLPLGIGPDYIRIGKAMCVGKDAGCVMIRPSPRNPGRYVCVAAGNTPAGMFLTNRLPGDADFVMGDAKGVVLSGYFGADWGYDERFVRRAGGAQRRAASYPNTVPRLLSAASPDRRLMLSDLLETDSTGSFARMRRDCSWQGGPIRLGGKTYKKGIAVNMWQAPCVARYDLRGDGWRHLRGVVGIEPRRIGRGQNPARQEGPGVIFTVTGDGWCLYRSPALREGADPVEMDVDIAGVRMLELGVISESAWPTAVGSVDWAGVRLEK